MFRVILLILVVVALGAVAAEAQLATLTDEAIAAAIAVGEKAKGKEHGLEIQERSFNRMMGADTSRGYRLVLYTPTTWIRQLASEAAKQYEPFTVADVTDDMLAPVLRVIVHANTPTRMTETHTASSAEHVVLRDKRRTIVVQPTRIAPFDADVSNLFGARLTYQSLQVTFPLDGLHEIRGPNGDAPFYVTVIGDRRDALGRNQTEKDFEIKRQHFSRLP